MKTKYFEIDNTPEVGRVNTFICHASGSKGFLHFFNVDIRPFSSRIKNIKDYGTEFFILKLFVRSSSIQRNSNYWSAPSHRYYSVDESSLEIIPISIEKRLPTNLIVSVVKDTGYVADGGSQSTKKLHKVIYTCLNKGIDLSDCCREITAEEYWDILDAKERKEKEETDIFLKALEEARLAKKEQNKEIYRRFFSKEDGLFHIIYRFKDTGETEEVTFEGFDEFYRACDGWLVDADLLDCNFDGIDLTRHNLIGAKINSRVMTKLGCYSDVVHREIAKGEKFSKFMPSESSDLVPSRMKYEVTETYPQFGAEDDLFLYISDLHINHKLLKSFPEMANAFEVDRFFKEIVDSLDRSMPHSWNKKVFIVGDVSYDFKFFKQFFEAYKKTIYAETYFVLGNHELWDRSLCRKCKSFDEMVAEFRSFLDSIGIELIESELKIPAVRIDSGIKHKYTAEELLALPEETIREAFRCNSYAILGGIGFSGLNEKFNCTQGIYRNAPITRDFEIQRSKLLSDAHEKLKKIIADKKLIVVTHMPFADWCVGEMVPNWIYVSGHTHKNFFIESDEATVYADNQIGYENESFGFKFFALEPFFNLFEDYTDGIHEISRQDYGVFNYGLGTRPSFNRDYSKLFLLKREKTYMFIMQKENNGPFYILIHHAEREQWTVLYPQRREYYKNLWS